jgi:hypothetical protein
MEFTFQRVGGGTKHDFTQSTHSNIKNFDVYSWRKDRILGNLHGDTDDLAVRRIVTFPTPGLLGILFALSFKLV